MSDRNRIDAAVIYERALRALGLERSLALLGVAQDLRSGRIPPEMFDMADYGEQCGTPCCMWGHLMEREGVSDNVLRAEECSVIRSRDHAFYLLTTSHRPSDPILAADAIERYVLGGSDDPWRSSDSAQSR
jgi:hypothetical protein